MVGEGNHSLPSKEKASEQVRIALTKRHRGAEKANTMLHEAKAQHKSKDYYGNKWEPVGKMVNNFSFGEFYPFYQWNILYRKATSLSSLLLFIQKKKRKRKIHSGEEKYHSFK